MNRKGQVLFYTLMLSALLLVLGLAFASPIKQFITTAMNEMNCSSADLDDGAKATCYGYDILLFFSIGLFLVLSIVVLGAKIAGY